MSVENIIRYHNIARVLWLIIRPIVVNLTRETDNVIDDSLVEALDETFRQGG